MSEIYGYSNREAIRVKVKKCESNIPSEWRKFSIDPQITSLEVLYSILAKAFDIKSDFSIYYKTLDSAGDESYLAVLSDWDLDAAFLKAHNISVQTGNEPCLSLRVDIKTTSNNSTSIDVMNDWESGGGPQISRDFFSLQQSIDAGQKYVQNMQNKLPGLIMNQMEKTFSMVQRALNLSDDQVLVQPPRPPLSDSEFRSFLDSVGQILRPNELRKVIFIGGIDPSLRKVVWKHILNIYPNGMTGRDRIDYMKKKAAEYYKLREVWKTVVQKGSVLGELAYVTSMVRKDVLRTDRLHPFYAGSDDNQNIASLYNILTTYALNHPSVSYCQGMSDIASPLLVTMGDEAHAYICFCAIMSRLKENFMLDGIAMTLKFTHLAEALHFYDPEFYDYLKLQQADDLLFCYRWLLLEMKREFAFEDSLRMLEVLWSSLRYEPPIKELNLYEKEFEPSLNVPVSPSPSVALRTPRENHYTKVCALRRQSSSASLLSNSLNFSNSTDLLNDVGKLNVTKRLNHSLDENIPRLSRSKNFIIKSHQSLDENKMIRLMESMTMLEEKTIDQTQTQMQTQNSITINNDQEESTNITNTSTAFNFHPTNPFFNDTDDTIKTETFDNEQNMVVTDNGILTPNTDLMMMTTTTTMTNEEKQIKDLKLNCLKSPNNNTKMKNKHYFVSTAEEIISKQLTNKNSGHFKELKEKLAASKKGIKSSLDKIDNQFEITKNRSQSQSSQNAVLNSRNSDISLEVVKNQKVVKNFKEFLNLSSINKNHQINEIIPSINANKINAKGDNSDGSGSIGGCGGNMVNSRSLDSYDNNSSSRLFENTTGCSSNNNNSSQINDKIIRQKFDDEQRTQMQVSLPKHKIQQQQQQSAQSHLIENVVTTNKQQQTQQYFDNVDNSSPPINLNQNENNYLMKSTVEEINNESKSVENSLDEVFGSDETLPISLTKNCNSSCSSSSRFMCDTDIKYEKLDRDSIDTIDSVCPETIIKRNNNNNNNNNQDDDNNDNDDEMDDDNLCKRISTCSTGNDVFIWENPLHQMSEASSCNFNEINLNENNSEMNKFNNISNSITDDSIMIDKSVWHHQTSNNTIKTKMMFPHPSNVLNETKNAITFPVNSTKNNNYCKMIDSNVTINTTTSITTNTATTTTMITDHRNNWKNSSNNSSLKTQQQSNNQILNVFKESKSSSSLSSLQNDEKSNDHYTGIGTGTGIIGMNTSLTSSITNSIGSLITSTTAASKMNNTSTSTTSVAAAAAVTTSTTAINNTTNSCITKINILPTPKEFGGGNPFLIFLCLTLLLQHRNFIMKNGLDYNEMAMHFDKMVRKHDVNRVLNQARRMYFEYLKTQHQLYQQQQQKQQLQQQQQQQQQQKQQQQNNNRVSTTSTTNYLESYSNNYKS